MLGATAFKRVLLVAGLVLWLAALVPGVRSLRAFENTAGEMGRAPGEWPAQMPPILDARLPALVVVLHPRCSCSQATLAQLEEVVKEFNHPFGTVLLIYRPRGERDAWTQAGLYREAQQRLQAIVVLDDDGELARTLGVFTSGEVLYYTAPDPGGMRHLLFSGGVTGARGMVGANAGVNALKIAANSEGNPTMPQGPYFSRVFGCGLSALTAATGKQAHP